MNNYSTVTKSVIAVVAIATLGTLSACGGGEAAAKDTAPAAPAQADPKAEMPSTPTPTPAPPVTEPPATTPVPAEAPTAAPAPQPQPPIVVEQPQPAVVVQQPAPPVVVQQPQPQVIVQQQPQPPVIVQQQPQPPVAYSDPWQVAPGVIENGVHYGYLSRIDTSGFYFDRADVEADGTWSNTNSKERYLPFEYSYNGYPGQAVEVHIVNQRVAAVFPA